MIGDNFLISVESTQYMNAELQLENAQKNFKYEKFMKWVFYIHIKRSYLDSPYGKQLVKRNSLIQEEPCKIKQECDLKYECKFSTCDTIFCLIDESRHAILSYGTWLQCCLELKNETTRYEQFMDWAMGIYFEKSYSENLKDTQGLGEYCKIKNKCKFKHECKFDPESIFHNLTQSNKNQDIKICPIDGAKLSTKLYSVWLRDIERESKKGLRYYLKR